ncbi:xylogalacturonan beta-1,3-xylosyltransferase [Ranunculus cassubicifolius]
MGVTVCTSTPFIVFSTLLLILFLFSTFTKQHIPTITTTTTSFSSYYFHLNQENISLPTQTTHIPNISSFPTTIPSPNLTHTSDLFNGLFSFHLSHSNNTTSVDTIAPLIREKSRMEKIEDGLAKARAAIREAVRTQNYTSNKVEDFIPRGSIYRNPYAFHQSHIEMEKRFRVWAYKEGEPPLVHDGPLNNIYSTEGQFMDEMESGKNPLMAKHPDEAHVFYLPLSVANVIRYVYKAEPKRSFNRDRLQLVVEDYIHVIANKYLYWNRSSGADHFMVSCHDWGPDISDAHPELFQHFIRVLCNANSSEGFQAKRDVSLPEIYLPFGRLGAPNLAKSISKRTILAFFAGGAHGKIRKILLKHWQDKDNEVQVHQYLPKGQNYTGLMGQSKYCLCPSGWEVASPRIVEAIQAGCVPVILSEDYILPFSDVLDWSKFSVQIPVKRIPEIKTILQGISRDTFFRMQKRVRLVQKHFAVNRPAKRFDVMHMVLHSIWLRRLNLRLPS